MSEREVVLIALVAFAAGTYAGAIGVELFAILRLLREAVEDTVEQAKSDAPTESTGPDTPADTRS